MADFPISLTGLPVGSPGAAGGISSLSNAGAAARSLSSLSGPEPAGAASPLGGIGTEGTSVGPAFQDVLNGFVHQVDGAQHRADTMVEALATGEPVDVHQVMLAMNEASNAMNLTLQLRNKALDAYQELMRLPM